MQMRRARAGAGDGACQGVLTARQIVVAADQEERRRRGRGQGDAAVEAGIVAVVDDVAQDGDGVSALMLEQLQRPPRRGSGTCASNRTAPQWQPPSRVRVVTIPRAFRGTIW